ncbi:Kinesin light chain [Fasciola hepatica]|uniref:Kinesin light chain n=1 Tax=Fasciola hepatica TaxID=6192 RepID=A0A4E0R5I4_FASHE|nr:Kinesin light chain [Fasciola hepatica]
MWAFQKFIYIIDGLTNYTKASRTVQVFSSSFFRQASALLKRGNVDDAESLLKAVLSPARTSYPSSDTPNGNTTDGDSAVFSLSSLGSSGFLGPPGSSPEPNGHSGLMNKERVMPLWLLIEQAAKEGRTQLTRLAKFDISSWALEARIELPIVLSALRNLAIVYQRQGLQPLACLLRHWIYVMTTNPTAVASSTVANAAQTTSSSIIPVPPATNSIQPVSSPRSDLIRDMTASFRSSPGPFVVSDSVRFRLNVPLPSAQLKYYHVLFHRHCYALEFIKSLIIMIRLSFGFVPDFVKFHF